MVPTKMGIRMINKTVMTQPTQYNIVHFALWASQLCFRAPL